ncbi:MAG: type IV toxin-antitoxin system AbiEi family antitoxin domain-containing protein [Thermosphaera sp.]
MPYSGASVEPYKYVVHRNTRKAVYVAVRRSGHLENLVLAYASTVSRLFSPSDVVVYFGLKGVYGANANKRVHDAVSRLVRRGYVERIRRGIYRLAVDVPPIAVADAAADGKESLLRVAAVAAASGGGGRVAASGGGFLVRLHVRPGDDGVLPLYRRLLFAGFVVKVCTRFLESLLVSRFGRCFVRRVRRSVLGGVGVASVSVGCHGRYGAGGGGLLPLWAAFDGLDLRQRVFAYELGFDVVVSLPSDVAADISRMFAKVYLRRLG